MRATEPEERNVTIRQGAVEIGGEREGNVGETRRRRQAEEREGKTWGPERDSEFISIRGVPAAITHLSPSTPTSIPTIAPRILDPWFL